MNNTWQEPTPNADGLTSEMHAAVAMWAAKFSTAEVSRTLRKRESDVRAWRDLPAVRSAVGSAQERIAEQTRARVEAHCQSLLDGCIEATRTLRENLHALDDDGEPLYSVRNQAASTLHSAGLKLGLLAPDSKPALAHEDNTQPDSVIVVDEFLVRAALGLATAER